MNILRAIVPRPHDIPPQGPPPLTWRLALGVLGAVLASLLSNLNTRITTFSLADLRGGFGYGVDESAWVTEAYNIAQIAIVPVTPWLASIISPRRAIAAAVALQTLAAVTVPAAPGYTALIALRFLEGAGGGALIPLLLLSVLRFLPTYQRNWGFAVYAMVTTLSPMISETLSGLLSEFIGWQAIFWVNVIPGPLIVTMVLIGLPLEKPKPEGFVGADYFGMLCAVVFVATLTAALGEGQRLDWFDNGLITGLFAAAAASLTVLVWHALSIQKPIFGVRLLGHANFTAGLLMVFAFSFATLGTSYVLPQFGTQISGYRELQIGAILSLIALSQIALCPLVAALSRVIDVRVLLIFGLSLSTVGCRLATYLTTDWVRGNFLIPLGMQACGQPFIMVPLLLIATSVLKPEDAVPGGTLFNMIRTLAGTFATSVLGAIVTVRERVHSNTITDHIGGDLPPGAAAALHVAASQQAYVMAYADAFGAIGVISIAGLAVILIMREVRIFFPPAAAVLLVLACAPAARAEPFDEALAQAYAYNPQLAAERQRLREIDEDVPRALSGWRPRVSIGASIGRSVFQDSIDVTHDPEHRYPQDAAATLTQPLYTGGRVPAQIAQAEALVRAERAQLQATEAFVLLAAATAYLDVARDQRVQDVDRSRVALQERTLRATDQQVAAGEVTEADAAQSRARLADARATLASARAELGASRARFEQQVGVPPGDLDLPKREFPALPKTHDDALSQAASDNFDVAAARATQDASRAGVDIVRAGLRPSVSFEARLERLKETDVQQFHQRDNLAEATLRLNIPLYTGGEVAAETRQARETVGRTQLQRQQAQRQARQLASSAWDFLDAARERVTEEQQSVAANEVALRGITRQQGVGARTLLEVLNAQQEMFAANVELVSAQHDAWVGVLQLLSATGRLSAAGLGLPAQAYDPARHYNAVRDRWGGTTPP